MRCMAGIVDPMSASVASKNARTGWRKRSYIRIIPVLLVLLGLAFMHGACMTHDDAAQAATGSQTHAVTGTHTDAAHHGAGHHQHDHEPGPESCCDQALDELHCAALLTIASLLTLAALGGITRGGILISAAQRVPGILYRGREPPPRASPRLALCVLRI
jgi:hypothetical protein